MLVFLPGEREIRDTAEALADLDQPGQRRTLEVLPLYSRLSAAEQHRVFSSHGNATRRIVLATNVAGDVADRPGSGNVVDTGVAQDQPLLHAHEGPAAADRADQPGIGQPALGPVRAVEAASRSGSTPRGGLRGPAGVHRPRDPGTNLASVIPQMACSAWATWPGFLFVGAARPAQRPVRRPAARGARALGSAGARA